QLPKLDFVIGDFNVTEDVIDRSPPTPNENSAVEVLRNIRTAWGIQDQWRHDNPKGRAFTHCHIRGTTHELACLNRIYTKRDLANCLFEWKICQPAAPTDHRLVSVKFAPKDSPLIGKGCWTCLIKVTEDDHLMETIIQKGIVA
ncbi:hypothetical protein BJV74DRAFT_789793, partial [Russula compacta]